MHRLFIFLTPWYEENPETYIVTFNMIEDHIYKTNIKPISTCFFHLHSPMWLNFILTIIRLEWIYSTVLMCKCSILSSTTHWKSIIPQHIHNCKAVAGFNIRHDTACRQIGFVQVCISQTCLQCMTLSVSQYSDNPYLGLSTQLNMYENLQPNLTCTQRSHGLFSCKYLQQTVT